MAKLYSILTIKQNEEGDLIPDVVQFVGINQNNVGVNFLRVVFDGVLPSPSETVHVSFSSDTLGNYDVAYTEMAYVSNGVYEIQFPDDVIAQRGTWYLSVALFDLWNPTTGKAQTTRSCGYVSFSVSASVKNKNGTVITDADVAALFLQARTAIEDVNRMKDEIQKIVEDASNVIDSANNALDDEQSVINTERIVKAILGDDYTGETSASPTDEKALYSKEQSIINTDKIVDAFSKATEKEEKEFNNIYDIIKNFAPVHKVDTYAQFADDIEDGVSTDYVSFGDKTNIAWVNTVTGTTTFGGTVACTDEQAFVNGVGECEESEYKILFFDGKWYYDGKEISLNEFGLTVTGTPKNGDFIAVNVTVNKVNFTFVSYDTATLGDEETGAHNWYLEETYCRLGTINFDQPESALCITPGNTLHAGKYFIRNVAGATGDYWCNYKRLYYCFVVAHDITATEATGDIQLRRTSIGSRETTGDARGVYQIYCKPYSCKTDTLIEDTTIEFVGQVAVPTEEYTDLRTVAGFTVNQNMDSTGIIYNNLGHACYGNNDFLRSNLCQYLNSDEKSIVPVRQHKNDVVGSIAGKKGYLYGLDPRVKKILAKNKIKLQHGVSDEYTHGADFTFEKTVSILTMKEMSFNIQTTEGSVTQLYNELTSGTLNNGAIAGRAKYNKEGGSLVSYRWSSSTASYSSSHSRTVSSTGTHNGSSADYLNYFAPAFIFAKQRNIKNQ